MDGENNGKPYEQMDDLGGVPIFLETPMYRCPIQMCCFYIDVIPEGLSSTLQLLSTLENFQKRQKKVKDETRILCT